MKEFPDRTPHLYREGLRFESSSAHRISMAQISFLKENELEEWSRLARRVIQQTPYYSSTAKKNEASTFFVPILRRRMASRTNIFLAAKEGVDLAGFLWGYIDGGIFWLDWVGVGAQYRRKGIAAQLLSFLARSLRKKNVHKIWCDTRKNNRESIALFRKFGYKKIAFLRRHWSGLDYFLWEKFL